MKRKDWLHIWWPAVCLCFAIVLCGCGDKSKEETDIALITTISQNTAQEKLSLNLENSISQNSDKEKKPGVLIDINGYEPQSEKTVFFVGKKNGGTFSVVNADTKETAFTGAVIKKDTSTDSFYGCGDFSSVTEEGNYYIESAYLGRSYTFKIEENVWESSKNKMEKAVLYDAKHFSNDFLSDAQTIYWLLLNEEFFGNETQTEESKMIQTAQIGAKELLLQNWETLSAEQLSNGIAALSKLYEAGKKTKDPNTYTYLKQAEKAYSYLEGQRNREEFNTIWFFYSAAQLYRATGYSKYQTVVKNEWSSAEKEFYWEDNMSEEQLFCVEAVMHGILAYLTTSYRVDENICAEMMDKWLEEAEKAAVSYKMNSYHSVSEDRRNRYLSDKLFCIAIAEHVIVSQEYVKTLEEGIHYLNGCNETGTSFVGKTGIYQEGIDNKNETGSVTGAYLFVMNEIEESEAAE